MGQETPRQLKGERVREMFLALINEVSGDQELYGLDELLHQLWQQADPMLQAFTSRIE